MDLRELRRTRGLTQGQLAALVGASSVSVGRWERGDTRPNPEALAELKALFALDADELAARVDAQTREARTQQAPTIQREIKLGGEVVTARLAPYVANGPEDQQAFFHKLVDLQDATAAPEIDPNAQFARLSIIQDQLASGQQTSQYKLERPGDKRRSWNSNYGSHGWHRYVGRFPPHLVRSLLNHFGAGPGDLVLDPFLGSGTTTVEARLLGIPSLGVEVCPLSAMMSRAKSNFPSDPSHLRDLLQDLESYYATKWSELWPVVAAAADPHEAVLQSTGETVPRFPNIERWFTAEALLGTSLIVQWLGSADGYARDFFATALSAAMRSVGNVDVDVVRAEYRKTPRADVDVMALLRRRVKSMIKDIGDSLSTHDGLIGKPDSASVLEASILDTQLEPGSVSHVITSPPYGVESVSYLRTHLLSYRALMAVLGRDPYELDDKIIGSEYVSEPQELAESLAMDLSPSCRAFFTPKLEAPAAGLGARTAMMAHFFEDMAHVIGKLSSALAPGGRVGFVVGNKRLGDSIIPTDTILTELFAANDIHLEDVIQHKLKTNNSNSQVPWQDRIIQDEFIMILRRSARSA